MDLQSRVMHVLNDINPEITAYSGNELLHDGVIDSFDVVEIAEALEDEFDFEIDAKYVVRENFASANAIAQLVQTVVDEQDEE